MRRKPATKTFLGAGFLNVNHLVSIAITVKHHFSVVGRRPVAVQGIITNQVSGPLACSRVNIDEHRSVRFQNDQICVPFQTGEPGGVAQRWS